MNDRDMVHIERIKDELFFINEVLYGKNKEIFMGEKIIQHAICMALITIGECAKHLSVEFKEKNSKLEWEQIVAVRNIAAHGYWQLNMQYIWQAMIDDVPKLVEFFDGIPT